ncbi:hypothetical protein BFF49_28005 [Shigella sp. FC2045]|nr:hypothetical protein BFF49_28005 [Shigella sp. FC2045]
MQRSIHESKQFISPALIKVKNFRLREMVQTIPLSEQILRFKFSIHRQKATNFSCYSQLLKCKGAFMKANSLYRQP